MLFQDHFLGYTVTIRNLDCTVSEQYWITAEAVTADCYTNSIIIIHEPLKAPFAALHEGAGAKTEIQSSHDNKSGMYGKGNKNK